MKLFVKIVKGYKLLTVCAKKLQALRYETLSKRDFNTVGFKWNFFKISNSNNLFEDFPAMSLTHNKSLVTCNSHNDKLIWKCIYLPKCYSEKNLVEKYIFISLFFSVITFLALSNDQSFSCFHQKNYLPFPSQLCHSIVIDRLIFEGEQLWLVRLFWI